MKSGRNPAADAPGCKAPQEAPAAGAVTLACRARPSRAAFEESSVLVVIDHIEMYGGCVADGEIVVLAQIL